MDLESFRQLLSRAGQSLLEEVAELAPRESDFLRVHQRFSKHHPSELVKAALETSILRRKARNKFSQAERMYFTKEGLEQSSGEMIAEYRSHRFPSNQLILDLCCGVGGDLIALAKHHRVIGVDLDELRLAMARENLIAYGRSESAMLLKADACEFTHPDIGGIFADPDRRADGERHISISKYRPTVQQITARHPRDIPLGIKIAPGISHSEIQDFEAESEFISVDGELKECVLWFGPDSRRARRAIILPTEEGIFADEPNPQRRPIAPSGYIYDPDPAVIRAGLVTNFADSIDAYPIHPEIAYLTSPHFKSTNFANIYEIDEVMPFHAKNIGSALKHRNVGSVSITKRGSAVNVDDLRKSWKLTGSESRFVILTRGPDDRPLGIIAKRVINPM